MNKIDRKAVRRTGNSFVFGGVSLLMFFPYERLTWNFALFLAALLGVALSAINLIAINQQKRAAQGGDYALLQRTRLLVRVAWWLTFIPFMIVVIGFIGTGILACSAYIGG